MQKQEHRITSGDLTLFAVTEGNPEAEPVILVHGYPDNHSVWDPVARQLAEQYFVIRYDVRGAGRSDKPEHIRDYRLPLLAADLKAVADTLIPERDFHLAAHDWGSIQSWESVTTEPLKSRITSYTSISGPCLDHVSFWFRNRVTDLRKGGIRQVMKQLGSSWYIAMFQLPVVPELIWQAGLDRLWPGILQKHEGLTDASFSPQQKDDGRYGINLYRANFGPKLVNPEARPASCPVQIIVPTRDNYVGEQLFEGLEKWVGKLTRTDLDAPHWVIRTHPENIVRLLSDFIGANGRNKKAA